MSLRRTGPIPALVAIVAAVAGCGGSEGTKPPATGSVTKGSVVLAAVDGSGVSGTAELTARDGRIQGIVSVRGLPAGSSHAMHIHGVAGEDHGCAPDERTDEHLANLPDAKADASGNATVRVDIEDPGDALRSGTYLMVHRDPGAAAHHSSSPNRTTNRPRMMFAHSTKNPPVACGAFGT